MAQADDVTINATTEHTTELARLTREYTVLYEKHKNVLDAVDRYARELDNAKRQAGELEKQVSDAKEKMLEVMSNG